MQKINLCKSSQVITRYALISLSLILSYLQLYEVHYLSNFDLSSATKLFCFLQNSKVSTQYLFIVSTRYLLAFDNEQHLLIFQNFLNNRHPNIKFTTEKQINHSIAFLDAFISGINNQNLTLQTYHKSTYTGLLLNFKSFTSFSCKISLIKCLIDRSFKISNNWNSFHNDIENI